MLKHISDWITCRLTGYIHHDEYLQTALSYGVNMAIYTIFSTMGLLGIGWLMRAPITTLVIVGVCYCNQTIGGGFHAKTHLKCFLTMTLFLVCGILLCTQDISEGVLCFIGLLSLFCLFFRPVVLHPRRSFLKDKLPVFAKRSRLFAALEGIILFSLFSFGINLRPFAIALLFSAISRIAAYFSDGAIIYTKQKTK